MMLSERQVKVIDLADLFGILPFGREQGSAMARIIETATHNETLLLETENIDGIGISFLRPAMGGLMMAAGSRRGNPLVAFMNPNEDIKFTFELGLKSLPARGLSVLEEGRFQYLATSPKIELTFDAAKTLTSENTEFTVSQLAESLSCQPNAAGERLLPLMKAGAVTRRSDLGARRGKKYIYRSLIETDLP